MARPTKSGLDYFPMDADFLRDRKIKRLRRTFGDKGVIVFQFLLCEIYRDKGYYVMYEDSLVIDVANEFGYTENLVRDTISFCATAELFDQRLLDDYQVITSTGIQKRYFEILKQMKRNAVKVVDDYFLLDRSDMPAGTVNIISRSKHNCNLGENPGYFGENPGYSGDNATKERKVNKTNTADAVFARARTAASAEKKPEIPAVSTMPFDAQESQLPITEELPNGIISADFIALLDEFGAKFNLIDGRCYYRQMECLVRDMHRPGLVDGITVVRDGLKRLDTAKAILAGKPKMTPTRFLRSDIFLKLINGDYDELYTTKQTGRPSGRSGTVIEGTDYSAWGE